MALQLGTRADNVAAYMQKTQDDFDGHMQVIDGRWAMFVGNDSIPEDVHIAAAEVLAKVVTALTNCRSTKDVDELATSLERGALGASLADMPELEALVNQASALPPSNIALLGFTVSQILNGDLEQKPGGMIVKPRSAAQQVGSNNPQTQTGQQGQQPANAQQQTQTQPAAAGTGQGQQAQQPTNTAPSRQPATGQQGQGQQPVVVVQQQPANAQAPTQGTSQQPVQQTATQQPANAQQQTQTQPAAAGTGQGQQAQQPRRGLLRNRTPRTPR